MKRTIVKRHIEFNQTANGEKRLPRSQKQTSVSTGVTLFSEGGRDYDGQTKRGAMGSDKAAGHSIYSWTTFVYEC